MAISNAQLKLLQSLKLKKFRQKYGKYVVEGPKMVDELISNKSNSVHTVYTTPSYKDKLLAKRYIGSIVEINDKDLKKVSALKTPNQVIAVAELPDLENVPSLSVEKVSLYLDRIQDPGNLGTIIRIADWFGIKHVVCAPGTVDVYSSKVIQSTMGAIYRVEVSYVDYQKLMEKNGSLKSFGAVLDSGQSIYDLGEDVPGLLVIGNESQGISPALKSQLDHQISIPRIETRGAESLNAAVACGIICGQLIRP